MKTFNLGIIFGVLKSWPVIVTAVAFLLVMCFTTFIINYRKKPPKSKKAKKTPPAPKPQPQEGAEGEAETESEE
ncbi:MAG: hypothetical protein MJ176_08030 [Treponema sp.]|nr:hypothetical protein [Treponema sp.]